MTTQWQPLRLAGRPRGRVGRRPEDRFGWALAVGRFDERLTSGGPGRRGGRARTPTASIKDAGSGAGASTARWSGPSLTRVSDLAPGQRGTCPNSGRGGRPVRLRALGLEHGKGCAERPRHRRPLRGPYFVDRERHAGWTPWAFVILVYGTSLGLDRYGRRCRRSSGTRTSAGVNDVGAARGTASATRSTDWHVCVIHSCAPSAVSIMAGCA